VENISLQIKLAIFSKQLREQNLYSLVTYTRLSHKSVQRIQCQTTKIYPKLAKNQVIIMVHGLGLGQEFSHCLCLGVKG